MVAGTGDAPSAEMWETEMVTTFIHIVLLNKIVNVLGVTLGKEEIVANLEGRTLRTRATWHFLPA